MPLKVKVITYKGNPPVELLEASFGHDGGTIGRSTEKQENHLTLPDPDQFISRKHASFTFENGLYYLTDTSVDGTYIQNKNMRIYRDTAVLADGDRLRIGDYELTVHISAGDALHAVAQPPVYSNEEVASISGYDPSKQGPGKPFGEESPAKESSLWWTDGDGFGKNLERQPTSRHAEGSPLQDPFTPPDIAGDLDQAREIPRNFNFEELISDLDEPVGHPEVHESFGVPKQDGGIDPDTPGKTFGERPPSGRGDVSDARRDAPQKRGPTTARPSEKPITPDPAAIDQIRQQAFIDLFQVFMDAAGVKDTRFLQRADLPELMQTVGAAFREMISGLMAVLRGRSELKNQLRVPATSLKPADNNPLKFSGTVDEALIQLVTKEQAGFVDAKDAVREGFADIMNHQLAMTAAIQAAVIRLLERFDPHIFAKQNEEGVVFKRKARSWDAYRQAYAEIAEQALEDFFGEPFAQVYEAQMRKLRPKTNVS